MRFVLASIVMLALLFGCALKPTNKLVGCWKIAGPDTFGITGQRVISLTFDIKSDNTFTADAAGFNFGGVWHVIDPRDNNTIFISYVDRITKQPASNTLTYSASTDSVIFDGRSSLYRC